MCVHTRGCGPNPRPHAKRGMALGLVCLICEMLHCEHERKRPRKVPSEQNMPSHPCLCRSLRTSAPLGSGPGSHCLRAPPFSVPTCPPENPSPSPTHLLIPLCSHTPAGTSSIAPARSQQDAAPPRQVLRFCLPGLPCLSHHCCCCSQLRPGCSLS